MDSVTQRSVDRFAKTVASLDKALRLERLPERAERDAALLRFELAAELMPKVLRRILSERGAEAALPKDAVGFATAAHIIADNIATALLAAIDDRNRMVHDYSEDFSASLRGYANNTSLRSKLSSHRYSDRDDNANRRSRTTRVASPTDARACGWPVTMGTPAATRQSTH